MKEAWKIRIAASWLTSVVLLAGGFLLLLGLPPYNPYSFREDFSPPLNIAVWEVIGSEAVNFTVDGLTLPSKAGSAFAIRRYLWADPKWQGPLEARLIGVLELTFRPNITIDNPSAYVILETDTLRIGFSSSSLIYYHKATGRQQTIADITPGIWYTVEIHQTGSAVEIKLDGSMVLSEGGIFRLTWLAIGNLEATAFGTKVSGSITVAQLTCLCGPPPG